MKKIFFEVGHLDKRCYDKFGLNEDILMEHASSAMEMVIRKKFKKNSSILIVSGVGNNGADGMALARLLYKDYNVNLFIPFGIKSSMAKLQFDRINKLGITIISRIKKKYDIIVDALFGSGLNKLLDSSSIRLIKKMNKINAYKIACDIPSGININGVPSPIAFIANMTITMGALKISLFNDLAKDYVGKIKVADLGISEKLYQINSNFYLLQKKDLKLPVRTTKNSNKGTYGHLNIIAGEKEGASILSAMAGFYFGSGLVSIISQQKITLPPYIMNENCLSYNVSAIGVGMGLGKIYDKKMLLNDIPKVIDADLFYDKFILELLKQSKIVLTPHPKEFISLLKLTDIDNIDIQTLQQDRFNYVLKFCQKYPNVVLVLKGANIVIGYKDKLYINRFGTNNLSKGGSGDVLSGLIASLLSQGYDSLYSAINGTLALTLASKNYKNNNYSLTPISLIKYIKKMKIL